ncbi:MAG: 50S ribosomal protein L7/L12 [Desulfotignum sp.]|nr:50S ribosomal protein L7/L12 [Desulfotignum sp.]MCF8113656.1 50S ribosomal protein L7/L12 [Desulfotignum sp.]MCF8125934.1 50S ribosomal protein L7/L12 [Desulfotignum sp.]
MADITKDDVIEFIANMTVLELSELIKELEEKFGVSAAAPVAFAAGAMPAGGDAAAAEEEKTEFDVVLEAIGDKKINVIKEVRAITGLGLKEAKALVEESPKPVKEGIAKEEAEKIKEQLEGAGAQVSIK